MKVKEFDCVKMKHDLQENLYNSLKPESFDDYFNKLSCMREKSELYKTLKLANNTADLEVMSMGKET
ncbi:MAG: hypothetical protein PF637_01150 [Spirochaetes bacterium]|jgi:hypothetical protein|nr:hypothetical protein [Spirochaetota bacterium]